MNSKNIHDVLNQIDRGYERYINLVNSLEIILDEASGILSEEDYEDFKLFLKDRIMEDL